MKKLFLSILVICSLLGGNANADYGGWIDMIVNSKEHKYCGDLARSMTSNKFKQTDIYYECRADIDIQQSLDKDFEKWKKNNK
jgi:hypothetical protein